MRPGQPRPLGILTWITALADCDLSVADT
jgi:hypothetical protein